jgi:hypothetical protein
MQKIKRFSGIIYTLHKIAFVALIVIGVLEVLSWCLTVLALHTETVIVGGKSIEGPILFKIGDFKVYLPVFIMGGSDFDLSSLGILKFSFGDVLQTAFTIVIVAYAKGIFQILRDNGSPFREDVVEKFEKLAISLLCVGVVTGVVGFLAASIVWVLCLIFDYGCALQYESDTTL